MTTIPPDTPAEWGDVDLCLTWLRERGWAFRSAPWWNGDGYEVTLHDRLGQVLHRPGPTLHAALLNLCRAVADTTQKTTEGDEG